MSSQNGSEPPLKVAQRRQANPWCRRALVCVGCVILIDGVFGERGLGQTMRARQDHARAVAALERLKDQNAALRDEIRRLSRDPAAIEAVARQELGLVRRGEILVVVSDVR